MANRAVDVADVLLHALARRGAHALLVDPTGSDHMVVFEDDRGQTTAAYLPAAIGDAVCARLAILADLDLGADGPQLGRLVLRVGERRRTLLVQTYLAQWGLGIELRRVAVAGTSEPTPEEPEAETAEEAGVVAEPVPGEKLGPYRLIEELGSGGAGVVYGAEHEVLGRRVAVKILHSDLAADVVVAARFVREARAASRVRHPGIVDVIDFGTLPDARTFLVMERIDGVTLEKVIDEQGAMDAGRAVAIARKIAAALDAAHRAGVVHRDLKPSNVFVLADDEIKLADFGAAKMIDAAGAPSDTQKGQVFGTPYYMSPEHARGLPTDRRTDIYALGCVLHEMLTGVVPFDAGTVIDILTMHIQQPLAPMQTRTPLPDVLERTVARALAKRAEERYQTAAEMIADLERAAAALGRTGWRRWLPA